MTTLNKKAFGGLLWLLIVIAVTLFLPAWTFNYWQAWVFLIVFGASVFAITLYLMKKDPKLLERRVNAGPSAEKEKTQKVIQVIASIVFIGIFILSVLDHRFRWSSVPDTVAILGDIFVAFGLLIVFFVFKENTFTSATIEVDAEQKVISTGPYSMVRHPMYIGAFMMLFGIPIALGSWYGLFAIIPMVIAIIWRLLDEEKFLAKNLPGYPEYQKKITYRLIPYIW